MRILGIDPGYAIVGFGVLEAQRGQARLVRCGAINTPAGVPMPQRLVQIQADLETLIHQFAPDVMAIEELFFNTNVTTGIGVAHGPGGDPDDRGQTGAVHLRIHPLPGQAGGGGVWQGGKAPGDGHDPPAAPSGRRPQAR